MRNIIVDNLRAVCMLGVIAIHTGSLALVPNDFTLYCLLEILSRYSVPAFFFISGYGLCRADKSLLDGGALSYAAFMKKRLRGAGIPYLFWSFFYMLYFWLILPPGSVSWQPLHVAFVLFFGLACYHLYFMVVLLWFYAAYPIWRALTLSIIARGVLPGITLLFIMQLAFNWWTAHPGIDVHSWSALARNFFVYRLNYLPLHYLCVFMGGALAAVYWDELLAWLRTHSLTVAVLYCASIACDAGSAYYSYRFDGYSLVDLANTYHQLSPQGLLYTAASLLFFCLALDWLQRRSQGGSKTASVLQRAVALLAANATLIYFIHPLLLDWLTSFYNKFGIVMTVKKVCLSYVLLVVGSLLASLLLKALCRRSKALSVLLNGK